MLMIAGYFQPFFLDSAFPFDVWDLGRRLVLLTWRTEAHTPSVFLRLHFQLSPMVKCHSGKGQPLPLCTWQPSYSLSLSSNFAALTSYWQQRHQLQFDLAYQLELVLLFLGAAAVCVTFTDDGWNVFRPLAGDG